MSLNVRAAFLWTFFQLKLGNMLVREYADLNKQRPWPYEQNWSRCSIFFNEEIEVRLYSLHQLMKVTEVPWWQGSVLTSGAKDVTDLDKSRLFPPQHIQNQQGTDFQKGKGRVGCSLLLRVWLRYLNSANYFFKIMYSYLGAFITQGTVEKGKNDMENPLVVIKLVAVLITQPFSKKSENPFTFYFVLEAIIKIVPSDI